MKKTVIAITMVFLILLLILFHKSTYISTQELNYPSNLVFKDREGRTLRFLLDKYGERHLWTDKDEIPSILKNAFISAEDENFYNHKGFSFVAALRALKDNLKAGKIVSGASTITQQVIKLIKRRDRTFLNKIYDILGSIRLEMKLDKKTIMEQYLNRIPLGNNLRGVKLASEIYFGKKCNELNPAECAFLAALPKSPGNVNSSGKYNRKLEKRKNWVLYRMHKLGYLDDKEYTNSLETNITLKMNPFAFESPHFVNTLLNKYKGKNGILFTTLDLDIQKNVENIVKSHREKINSKGANQASALIVKNSTMEVISMAGSFEYSSQNNGFNNGTNALRSAGSTLKPFLYCLGLDSGCNTSLMLSDIEKVYKAPKGDYVPKNYDKKEYGPISMRTALGNSLNLSAINMIEKIGCEEFYDLLKNIKLINYPDKTPDYYGLGMAIGNIEVTLQQLVASYAMLANGGIYRPLKFELNGQENPPEFVFSSEASYIITDILSDPSARMLTFNVNKFRLPFKIALKTGTSTHYRDGWVIGYTPEYTVGVWVGNFEGNPTYQLSGEKGAVPIFYDIINFLYSKSTPEEFKKPDGVFSIKVCSYSGMKPTPFCPHAKEELFNAINLPRDPCIFHIKDNETKYLPPIYANWLYEKYKKGATGNYRLSGFEENLDMVFENSSIGNETNQQTINVHSNTQKNIAKTDNKDKIIETIFGHHSIGTPLNIDIETENHIEIIYPLNDDRFIIDKNIPNQVINLQATSEKSIDYIKWYIDGKEYAETKPPYDIYWKLKKGLHTITILDTFNNADEVTMLVE